MKFLGYYLLCLFVTRVQLKPQITKLLPVEGLAAYHKQFNDTTMSVDKFWEKLRTTYNFVFHQSDNNSSVEKTSTKNAADHNLQALKLIFADTLKGNNYTNLKYPNNTFLDQVKSLSALKNRDNKTISSKKDSSVEIKATVKTNANNVNAKTKMSDDDWLNDIQPLSQLELQDDELNKKNEVEIVTPETTSTVGHHLFEWLGSLFGLTYSIYSKLSAAACGEKAKH